MINHGGISEIPQFSDKAFFARTTKITLASARSDVHTDPPASVVRDAGAFQRQALSS